MCKTGKIVANSSAHLSVRPLFPLNQTTRERKTQRENVPKIAVKERKENPK